MKIDAEILAQKTLLFLDIECIFCGNLNVPGLFVCLQSKKGFQTTQRAIGFITL